MKTRSYFGYPLFSLAVCGMLITSTSGAATLKSVTAMPASPSADEQVSEQCAKNLAAAGRRLEELMTLEGPSTIESVLDPYNELTRLVTNGSAEAELLFNVHPDGAVREAHGECNQEFSKLATEIGLSREVFDAISAVDQESVDAETRYFLNKELRDFRLNGVDKGAEDRARIQQLNEELVKLGQEFAQNIATDVRSISVESADSLAGLPEDWIAGHPPDEDGKIRITTDYPDFFPLIRYAKRDDIRRDLTLEFRNRGYPKNVAVLRKILQKRHELAGLLGFESWAERALADKMIGTEAQGRRFIDEGSASSRPLAQQDYAALLERLQQIEPEATEVSSWQRSYLSNLVRAEKYDVNSEEVRQYFEFSRVQEGIFDLVHDLFGVTIRNSKTETWHEDVDAYEMLLDDQVIGRFMLDMHPRADKFKHAAMFQLRYGVKGAHLPEAVLVCNFPGGGGEPGLMEESQVSTFLHEFGHLVHWMFMGNQRWVSLTTPEFDFIEAPSMMLSEWIYDTETLQNFAVNSDGEPIPAELVAKMRRARDFGQGMFVSGQMHLAAISLSLHNRDPESFEFDPLIRELHEKYSVSPFLEGSHMYTSFGHLTDYSAFYYTYMWSLVIAYDMYSRFEAEGLRNLETARDYRDKVLAAGGSKPAADFVQDFLGRPYNFDAFKKRLATAE